MRGVGALGVFIVIGGIGCGGAVDPPGAGDSASTADSRDGGGAEGDTSTADVPSGFDVPFRDTGTVIDGGGGCTPPDTVPGYGIAVCCNGLPCAGECVETSPGKNECRCADISGGVSGVCSEPYVCCKGGGGGCQTREICNRGH
jgi:hypothetical protein